MLRLVLLSALVALAVARTPKVRPVVPMLDGRIVGGVETTIEEHPYQVSLQYWGSHICGASIIASDKILTAAHCTEGSTAESLTIRAGSTIRNVGGQLIQVSKICDHPSYDTITVDNDVSVLTLSSSLIFGLRVKPINLPSIGSSVATGTHATIAGWGTTSSGGTILPTVLQKVAVPKVTQADCEAAYGSSAITVSMTCYGWLQGGKDSCQGDSGGPLAIGNTQVGVVSWGDGCAAIGKPGVYADTAQAIIQDHIKSC